MKLDCATQIFNYSNHSCYCHGWNLKPKIPPQVPHSVLNPTGTMQKGFPALKTTGFHPLLLSLQRFGLFSPIQQLTDEKTCMQFSIRRPKLPSSETHPEENTYKRLDVAAWLHHLNEAGQVEEEYRLRKVRAAGALLILPLLPPAPRWQLQEFPSLLGVRTGHLSMWRWCLAGAAGEVGRASPWARRPSCPAPGWN